MAPGFPENIRLGCKFTSGINTLAYYKNEYITEGKAFITLGPGVCTIKTLGTHSVRIAKQASVFFKARVLLTENKKDTSLPQNMSISCTLRVCYVL